MTKDKAIIPLLLVNFIGVLGYSVVLPVLIFIVARFGGNGIIYGIIGAAYPLFQFIGAPILGRMSDRIGRKKVLLISQLGTFFSWVLFLVAFAIPKTMLFESGGSHLSSFEVTAPLLLVFVARSLDGLTGGNISVANAYMSDISTAKNRSANFGKMGASSSLGFVLGPAMAGLLASTVLGEVLPLLIAMLIAGLAVIVISRLLPDCEPGIETEQNVQRIGLKKILQVEHRECISDGETVEYDEINSGQLLRQHPGLRSLLVVYFLTYLAFSLFYAGMPLFVSQSLEGSSAELGLLLACFSLVMIVVQGPVLSRLAKKYSELVLTYCGTFLLAIGMLAMSQGTWTYLYLGVIIMAMGNGIMWSSFLSILAGTGDKHNQGQIQGLGGSMGSLASILGLIIGAFFMEQIGASLFYGGAILFLLILLFLPRTSSQAQ